MLKKRIIRAIIFAVTIGIIQFTISIFNGLKSQHKVEAPVILSMEELGYPSSSTHNSQVKSTQVDAEVIDSYVLSISYQITENVYYCIEVLIHDCPNNKSALLAFESGVISIIEKDRPPCTVSECYYPPLIYEDVIAEMYELDLQQWNADKGYAKLDYNDLSNSDVKYNTIILCKENQILYIEITTNIELTPERITALRNTLNKTDLVFTSN